MLSRMSLLQHPFRFLPLVTTDIKKHNQRDKKASGQIGLLFIQRATNEDKKLGPNNVPGAIFYVWSPKRLAHMKKRRERP